MIDWIWIVMGVPIFILAGTVHEYMHAWVARKLGDPTAEQQGRLTLNPLSHIELYGVLLMVFAHFGWMKPVPVAEKNFEKPVRDMALVAIAGPISNIIMASLAALLLRGLLAYTALGTVQVALAVVTPFPIQFLIMFIWINAALAVFNMIPIPPLDGYRIVRAFLPEQFRSTWESLENYSWIILLVLFMPFSPLADLTGWIVGAGVEAIVNFLL